MRLKIRRIPLDTLRENVAVLASNCSALRPEAFQAFKRLEVQHDGRSIIASLDICRDLSVVGPDEIGLTEPAFRRMGLAEGDTVFISPARSPQSLDYVRTKIGGETLNRHQIESIVQDIVGYRYSDMEIAAFLVACAGFLSTDELLHLTFAMAAAGTTLRWDAPVVVDKHCIGGIPGNRTSMIVVPIVAAHGLIMPKTSSRAITSPAGTADTMEVLARVDLTIEEMKEVVRECNACLVWGGHVNLSPADDSLLGVERPQNLDTREQMVASIMSKKKSAGSTHLVIDLPLGPTAKVRDAMEAMRLRKLFEFVADRMNIHLEIVVTDGAQPVGRGIGPVLEARDVMAVLANDISAPADLREKSLLLAARVIECDPAVRGGAGYERARQLLESGAAMTSMQKIIETQGRGPSAPAPGPLHADVLAHADGVVASVDCLRIAQLARLAGAPLDRGAGIDIFKRIGDRVETGEPLYRIYSAGESHFDFAVEEAGQSNGFALASTGIPAKALQ